MVPAGLAISGVSAHACSHHRGCRGQPVCTGVTTPTRTTGGPLGGELTTAHAAASRPHFSQRNPHDLSALRLGRSVPPPRSGLSVSNP